MLNDNSATFARSTRDLYDSAKTLSQNLGMQIRALVTSLFQILLLITFSLFGAAVAQANITQTTRQQSVLPLTDDQCASKPYSILVTIYDVRHSKGTITADLHGDDPDKFLDKGQKLDRIRVPAVEGQTQMCIPIQTPGVYAIVLYHDEDADTKFDKNIIGLPAEPFGLSRDPRIRLAMPKHSASAFEVNGPLTPVKVTLRH